jgi:glycosyltransferase involved in cell wall biosynthesis
MPLAPVYACLAAGYRLRGKPVVFTIHNVLSHENSAIYFSASRLLFKLGDHFIVHSDKNRRQLTALYGIPADRTSLIPHGSLDFQVRPDVDRDALRSGLGFAKKDKVILLFGAIRPYKGVDTAMQAFAKIVKALPQAKLLIAGLPWEDWGRYRSLMDRLQIASAVHTHLDYIPAGEVHRYFEAADLVLLPYHHFDSQSGVGSSAIAFRKPMIVSNVGGLPDLVKDPRWVVPPADSQALASAALAFLKDPSLPAEMAAAADAIAAELDWAPIAKRTWAVYRRLAPHPKPYTRDVS